MFGAGSADPFGGKAVRASAGSLFHVDVVRGADLTTLLPALRDAGVTVLAADGGGEAALDEIAASARLAGPVLWLFGNEARGVPAELAALADAPDHIPMRGRAESLNLAAAAAICLYTTQLAQGHERRSPDCALVVARAGVSRESATATAAARREPQIRPERRQRRSEGPPMSPTSRRKATSPADASRSFDR